MTQPPPAPEPPPTGVPDAEIEKHKLPCDVRVGDTIYRAGVPLLALVELARRYHAIIYKGQDFS
jgi:hypothetical protein